jgi:hypothetical protein
MVFSAYGSEEVDMVVFEGVVAAIVGVALLAALLQFTGFAPTGARASQTIAQPTVVEPMYDKWAAVGGSINFVRKAGGNASDFDYKKVAWQPDAFSYSKDGLKINCTAITISALDSAGKTVASTKATNGVDPGTCSYKMRVPADTALTLNFTDGGKGSVWAFGGSVNGLSAGKGASWGLATADKWQTVGHNEKFQLAPDTSKTVPLSIAIGM